MFILGGFRAIEIRSCILPCNKLLSAYYVVDTVLGNEKKTMSKRQGSCPRGTYVLLGKADNKRVRE